MARWWSIGIVSLVLLAACSQPTVMQKQRLYLFGTLVDVELDGVSRQQAETAFTTINHDFLRMHIQWHAWKPDGELYRINRNLGRGVTSQPVSPFVQELIDRSNQIYRSSNGLFNPAIGQLIDLWGFHQDGRPDGPPPTASSVKALVDRHPGMDDITIQKGKLVSRNRAVNLDFGAIAKGHALDLARKRLKGLGVKQAMLNAGGDLCVMGRHQNRPWHVGIRHPQGHGVLAAIDVDGDECVMTSGNYERFREHKHVRYAHILDPRSGWPVQGVVSVTVVDSDGALADAAATALTVAGGDGWYRIARQMGLRYVMLVTDDGTVHMSPAMAERVRFEGPTPVQVVLSRPLMDVASR